MLSGCLRHTSHSSRGKNDSDDEAVKSDTLSKDHHENDSDQNVSVLHTIDASFSAKSNRESRGHRGETDCESGTKVLVAQVIVVSPLLRIGDRIRQCFLDYLH